MKHKIVIGAWLKDGLPFSRKACEALAAIGVESAVRHMKSYGDQARPEWSEMSQDYVSHDRWADYYGEGVVRHDPRLVQVVENLGAETTRGHRDLRHSDRIRIVEIEGDRYAGCKASGGYEYVKTPIQWKVIQ